MPLLEREHALAALCEYAESAAGGDGRVVLVSGEAGVGKSTLLEGFEAATPQEQFLHGACDGLFTPRPLGPLFDVAEQLGGDLLAACRADAPREELFRLFLTELTGGGLRWVVVFEDIHWADESTLDLLRFVGRRVRNAAVLLICTYRDDELGPDHPLRLALGQLAASRSVRRMHLAPLSEAAVRRLAAGSGIDPAELYRLSGGNPFLITEVLQSGSSDVPESARDAVLARLACLGPAARRVAEAAALIGTQVEPRLLDAVAAASPPELDELLSCGLLVSDRGALRFRHEIARLTVEREVPAHRRKETHRRALAALRTQGSDDEARLAYHADGAEDADAVLRFAPAAAARASSLGSHREAAAQYERAIRFADERDAAALAELYDLLAKENSATDICDRAAEAGGRALGLWRQIGDRHHEGATLSQLSRTMWRLCRPESRQYAEDAVATLEPLGASPELAWAYAARAAVLLRDAARDSTVAVARRAQALAAELGLPDVLSDALYTEACMVSSQGGDWQPLMERALDVAVAAGAQHEAGRAYANMWFPLLARGRLIECAKYLDEGMHYCDEHDLATYGFWLRAGQATLALFQGRWDEAVAIARSTLGGRVSSPANRTLLILPIGIVLARRGDAGAWTYLDEALNNAIASGEDGWHTVGYPSHAEAHWLAGDLDAARADLAVAARSAHAAQLVIAGRLVSWYQRLGMDVPDVPLADDDPARHALAGDFIAAASGWDEYGMPYEAALSYYDSGTEEGLREAINRFDALGARAAVEATRREMRRIGVRSIPSGAQAATRAHPLGLTRRQAQVLERICAGRTNAEISADLFLSPRTVENHVSAVLAKLGVSSRTQAASEARRQGLVSAPG